jgi:hypothetical protein
VSTRFRVDLLHPGVDLGRTGGFAQNWEEWFTGPTGMRRLALLGLACAAVLIVILVAGIIPPYWQLSKDLSAVPGLRRDLAAREQDLNLLRSNLSALSDEARKQVRWGEVLGTLSQQIPATMRLQSVDVSTNIPGAGAGSQAPPTARLENVLRIEAVTPLRPGSPPLLEVAQFMAGIMRDPAINRRFQLKSWEIKPSPPAADGSGPLLHITILLAERA